MTDASARRQPTLLLRLVAWTALLSTSFGAAAETIAVIGTGQLSRALGPRFAEIGHQVVYGSRSPDRPVVQELVMQTGEDASATTPRAAASQASIIVIGVPWDVAEEVVLNLGDLAGKIIIDPINPRIINDEGYRDYPTYTSNAERIQNLAPRAHVVKAFNTMSSDTMTDPDLLGHPITVPIVGNDSAAKETVAAMVRALGYEPLDLGPVRYAHVVEGLYLLRLNARDMFGTQFEYHFRQDGRNRAPIRD